MMKQRKFTRAVLGDIVEIPLTQGFAYAQYVFKHADQPTPHGDLIRVFPGTFKKRPDDFSKLNATQERFVAFFLVGIAVRRKIVAVVGHADVPERLATLPLFKAVGLRYPGTNEISGWWLWDGKNSWQVDELTAEQKRLPLRQIIGFPVLVERIESGWAPEDEVTNLKVRKKPQT